MAQGRLTLTYEKLLKKSEVQEIEIRNLKLLIKHMIKINRMGKALVGPARFHVPQSERLAA